VSACSSTAPSSFYTLSAITEKAAPATMLSVTVGPVSVPAIVDRPEIVVSTSDNQVRVDEFNRWASPLQDNLARVIAANLSKLLGTPRVSLFPQALSAEPDYRVAIEVQRFESTPGKSILLDAVWTVRRAADAKTETGRTTFSEPVTHGSYDTLAAAHSRAVNEMCRAIAETVRKLEASRPTVVPKQG
jgi:uncharacterized lipoprotein YmbA